MTQCVHCDLDGVLAECARCGRPCCSNCLVYSHQYADYVCGPCKDPEDPQPMSEALLTKFRQMAYDDLADLGIRLARIIERGAEFGARHEAEQKKLALVDQVLKEKEQQEYEALSPYDRWQHACLLEYNARYGEQRILYAPTDDYNPETLVEFGEDGAAYPHGPGGTNYIPNAVTPWRRSPHYRP